MRLKQIKCKSLINIAAKISGAKINRVQILIWLFVDDLNYCKQRPAKLNHENIHFQQGIELLFVGFWLLYFINYIINLIIYKFDRRKAYKNIIFEKEAYKYESNLMYLRNRKRYAWIRDGISK
jgi:hypothetical protein